jgi:carbon-monoxide dehydrogenase iron sulfur subunit
LKGRVHVDVERCVTCKRCVLACAVEHSESKELFSAMTEVPAPRSRVKLTKLADDVSVPTECRHCDAAACVAACPTGALFKSGFDGPVVLAMDRCVGCASCMVSCPYGVVRHDGDKLIYKCDLCVERLAKEDIPACVEACPTDCLTFKSQAQMNRWLSSLEQVGHGLPNQEE